MSIFAVCVIHISDYLVFMFESFTPSSPGVVGSVERSQADFSFNLVLTGQREKAVDFGLPYIGEL